MQGGDKNAGLVVLPSVNITTSSDCINLPEVTFASGLDIPQSTVMHTLTNVSDSNQAVISNTSGTLNSYIEETVVATIVGDVLFPKIDKIVPVYNCNHGNNVQSSANSQRTSCYLKTSLDAAKQFRHPTWDIIGDNLDWTKNPSYMTKNRQRESIHWFLNVGVKRRVTANELSDVPRDIRSSINHRM